MDGGAWWATVHGVSKGWTGPSNFTFTFLYLLAVVSWATLVKLQCPYLRIQNSTSWSNFKDSVKKQDSNHLAYV